MSRFDHTRAKTARARNLRREATRPERILWSRLRAAQMHGFSFRRQHPVGPYVLDFYCPAAKLAVELDGDQHGSAKGLAHDAARARFLASKGIHVLRFANFQFWENLDGVLEGIVRMLILPSTPTWNASRSVLPLSGGGE